jgi:hypothetical protein
MEEPKQLWMIQGADGPIEASRPSDEKLALLKGMDDRNIQVSYALSLANEGFTIDAAIDVEGGDYDKVMAQRRRYGYTWIPAVGQSNVPAAPALGQEPPPAPLDSILVPPEGGWQ